MVFFFRTQSTQLKEKEKKKGQCGYAAQRKKTKKFHAKFIEVRVVHGESS